MGFSTSNSFDTMLLILSLISLNLVSNLSKTVILVPYSAEVPTVGLNDVCFDLYSVNLFSSQLSETCKAFEFSFEPILLLNLLLNSWICQEISDFFVHMY